MIALSESLYHNRRFYLSVTGVENMAFGDIDQETVLLLAIITLIIIGVFSAILNYWMWNHWKRTMGLTKEIVEEEILEPVTMGGPTEPEAAPAPPPPPEPAPPPEQALPPEPAPERTPEPEELSSEQ
jgi:hypothetical protein